MIYCGSRGVMYEITCAYNLLAVKLQTLHEVFSLVSVRKGTVTTLCAETLAARL